MKKVLIVVLLSLVTVSTYAHDDIYLYLYPDTNNGVAVTGDVKVAVIPASNNSQAMAALQSLSGWVADGAALVGPEAGLITAGVNALLSVVTIGTSVTYENIPTDPKSFQTVTLTSGGTKIGNTNNPCNAYIQISAGMPFIGASETALFYVAFEWQGQKFFSTVTILDPCIGECSLTNYKTEPTNLQGCVTAKLNKVNGVYNLNIYLNNISEALQTDSLIINVDEASAQNGYPKFVVNDIKYSMTPPNVSSTDSIVQNNEPDSNSVYLRIKAPEYQSEEVVQWFLDQAGIANDGENTGMHILPLNELQNEKTYTVPKTMSYALKGTLQTSIGTQNLVIGYGGSGNNNSSQKGESIKDCTWIAYSNLYNRTSVPLDIDSQTQKLNIVASGSATLPNAFISVNSSNAINIKHGINIPEYVNNNYVTINSETYNDYVAQGTINQLFKDSDININIGVNALNGVKGKMSLQAIPLTEDLFDQLSATVQESPNKLIDMKKYKVSGFTGDSHIYWYDPSFGTAELITVDLVGKPVFSPKVNTDWQVRYPFNYTYKVAGKQLTTPFDAFQVTFTYNSSEVSDQTQISNDIILPTGGQEKLYNGRKYTVLTTEEGLENIKKIFPDAVSVPVTVGAIGTKTDSTPVEKITFTPAPSKDYMVSHTDRILSDANKEAGVNSSDNPTPEELNDGSRAEEVNPKPLAERYIAPPLTPIFNISSSSFVWEREYVGVSVDPNMLGPTENKYMRIWEKAVPISSVQLDGPRVEDCIGKEGPFTIVVKDGYVTPVGEWATKFSVTGGTVDVDKSHPGNEIGIAFNYIWKGKAGNFVIEFGYDSTNKQLRIQNTYNVPTWMNVSLIYINGYKLLLLIENIPVDVNEEKISISDIQTITIE